MNQAISVRGAWPGAIVLRSGWWRASARPVNDDLTDQAALRVDRGSVEFVRRCAMWLLAKGASRAISPPLARGSERMWAEAGFRPGPQLALMERDLGAPIEQPTIAVRRGTRRQLEPAADIDRLAFPVGWRIGRLGLDEAIQATSTSRLLVCGGDDSIAGFAIVGVTAGTGYLQRIAVDPAHQGRGAGSSLIRVALAWARAHGARTMLLNTQIDNEGAARLYRAEGFEMLLDRLTLYVFRQEEIG